MRAARPASSAATRATATRPAARGERACTARCVHSGSSRTAPHLRNAAAGHGLLVEAGEQVGQAAAEGRLDSLHGALGAVRGRGRLQLLQARAKVRWDEIGAAGSPLRERGGVW
jgi:hypothetical protein